LTLLRPFFPYFGGKWRAAKHYPEPVHGTIIEPFAGAAGYALRYASKNVVLYDANPVVAGTWDYLINASEEELSRLPLYDGTWESTDDLQGLPQEARWLIGWWLNKGAVHPGKRPSAWVRAVGANTGENVWGQGVINRLVRQVPYIRHWQAHNLSYIDAANVEATWFIDPPYEVAGKYPHRDIDFDALGVWCRSRNGQVIVCENEGSTWLPFQPLREIKGTAGRGRSGVSREAIWTSGSVL